MVVIFKIELRSVEATAGRSRLDLEGGVKGIEENKMEV